MSGDDNSAGIRVERQVQAAQREASLQRAHGTLRLRWKRTGAATRLDELFQQGCLKARLPRQPASGIAEAVTLNTAGGLTDGDIARTSVTWNAGTQGLVATQAAERIYRCRDAAARIQTTLKVAAGATACWLPQETILFDGARLQRTTRVELEDDARLFAAESCVFGRVAMREQFATGALRDRLRIQRDGRLLFTDALALCSDRQGPLHEAWRRAGVGGASRCIATLIFAAPDAAETLPALRKAIDDAPALGGATDLGALVVMRLLAADSRSLRATLLTLYGIALGDAGFHEPRVWHC